MSESEVLLAQLSENGQRSDLNGIESAEAMRKLMTAKLWTPSELAEQLHTSPATVSRTLALLHLPKGVRDAIEAGKIPSSSAYELTKLDGEAEQLAWGEKLASGAATRSDVSEASRHKVRNGSQNATSRMPRRVVLALSNGRSVTFSGPHPAIEDLQCSLREVAKRLKEAAERNLGPETLAQVLADEVRGLPHRA